MYLYFIINCIMPKYESYTRSTVLSRVSNTRNFIFYLSGDFFRHLSNIFTIVKFGSFINSYIINF